MPHETSESTKVIERLVARYRAYKDENKGKGAVPFMQEKMPRRTARERIKAMTPAQRRALVVRIGLEKALDLVGRE